ncbi:MAG: 2-dehydro-3-deoxygalactonokinase [Ahrensia sp.]|nr:2-dehydro-3-deoxygalactonokinase [Ahrensia sp.]
MSDGATPISVVAVDWGTSQLRIWPLDRDGNVAATYKSGEGMRNVSPSGFASLLEQHLTSLEIEHSVPVIMCGMVGSRQGWCEVPYVDMPCRLSDIIEGAVAVPNVARDIRILPGLANRSTQTPDVMRSEETQLLGLHKLLGDDLRGHVCMPGSHAKWVRIEKGVVIDFATSLTGELYAALGSSSVLKHALASGDQKVDAQSGAFVRAVRASLAEPATILTRLFSARPNSLLHDLSNDDAAAHISGTIIGQDIAGAMARFSPMHSVALVGSGHLGTLYASALEIAGLKAQLYDGDELALGGLCHAARLMWPSRFDNRTNFKGMER